ncbi:MAG TPA: ABC transporter permease [Nitrososphaerales archaeon]|nr:ABC transporter permease [Nitrososphaerales archaeon]
MELLRPSRVFAFAAYEIRRALARKKVLAMVGFIALLDTVPYYILATSGTKIIPLQVYPYLWVAGVLAPFALFMQFVAILIAAGAMSEEYESGTAELLLAKPVGRTEYFFGKFLGGYALLALLILLNALLSVVAATLTYGAQAGLDTLPGVVLVEVYSSALFFSVAFMLGELIRRSSLAYILSSALIVASQIIGTYLSIAYELTGNTFYESIHIYLPTTLAGSLPPQYEQSLLPSAATRLFQLILGPAGGTPSVASAAILVGVYLIVTSSVALAYFRWADVARRVS